MTANGSSAYVSNVAERARKRASASAELSDGSRRACASRMRSSCRADCRGSIWPTRDTYDTSDSTDRYAPSSAARTHARELLRPSSNPAHLHETDDSDVHVDMDMKEQKLRKRNLFDVLSS